MHTWGVQIFAAYSQDTTPSVPTSFYFLNFNFFSEFLNLEFDYSSYFKNLYKHSHI
jgi:hypothetical protein